MTEDEWQSCTDPQLMLDSLRDKVSERKLRLFAVACCRLLFFLLKDDRVQQAVLRAEDLPDDDALDSLLLELQRSGDHLGALVAVLPSWSSSRSKFSQVGLFNLACALASNTVPGIALTEDDWDMPSDPAWRTAYFKEKEKQAALLRDV